MVSAGMPTRMATTSISGERVLILPFMPALDFVASAISRLVSLEVIETLRTAFRQRSVVAVMRVIPVIDMPVKVAWAVKPRACSNKDSANKPIWPVVAVRSAVVGRVVEVSVRTHGRRSDVYANLNLSLRSRGGA